MLMNSGWLMWIAVVACAALSSAGAADEAPVTCPVTLPLAAFVPPPPYEAREEGRFWYGTKALWTSLADDGIWRGIASASGVRNKVWWWRAGWEPQQDAPYEGLIVTGNRLDATAPPARSSAATNGLLGTGWAMLVMLELPTRGCWAITGNYGGDTLSFVVWAP
jgi:hypothetical protein